MSIQSVLFNVFIVIVCIVASDHEQCVLDEYDVDIELIDTSLDSMSSSTTDSKQTSDSSSSTRQPVLFISHGGGPCFFMEDSGDGVFAEIDKNSKAANFFRGFAKKFLHTPPKAILVISAHWLTPALEMTSGKKTSLYYDYYGFPPDTYEIQYPCPGDPTLSARIQSLLKTASTGNSGEKATQFKVNADLNTKRGLDHGVFLPLKLIYPDANIPVIQLSLLNNLDPAQHVAIGKALQPLRDEGVLIVGSGQATHNMRAIFTGRPFAKPGVKEVKFTNWLTETAKKSGDERDADLIAYRKLAPESENAHPKGADEHLIPIMVCSGAAGEDSGKSVYNQITSEHFALHTYLWG